MFQQKKTNCGLHHQFHGTITKHAHRNEVMNGTLLDGEVGFKKIHFNGTRGTAVKFNNAMNISTEMKWKDCFDFRSDSILFTAEQREIRSFNRLFKNRTNVENIHGLCNALKQCVDGDPCQAG